MFFFWKIPASITIRDYVLKALVTALTVIKHFIKPVTKHTQKFFVLIPNTFSNKPFYSLLVCETRVVLIITLALI